MRSSISISTKSSSLLSIGALAALFGVSACATTAAQKAPTLPMRPGPGGEQTITPPELVSMTQGLADSYVGTIVDAINSIQAEQLPPEVRTSAQRVKVFVGTTAYTIATSPNPQIGLIDLTVNIAVQRSIWNDGLARERFGERAAPLLEAYKQIDEQAWATLGRVFAAEQLQLLRDGIQHWMADHPHFKSLPLVHLPALARYRDVSLLATPGGLRMLAPVAEAARAAMELRLLGERSVYLAQRFPYLINWQSELLLYNSLNTPEARSMLDSTRIFASSADRMAGLVTQLPNTELVQQTIAELNGTLKESVPLLATMRGVVTDLNLTLDGANRMLAPFQTPAVGGGPPDRTFDVAQYTSALHELGSSVRELNSLLANTKALVGAPELGERLGQVQSIAASGMGRLGDQGDHWIDRIFWRGVLLVVLFFAAHIVYRAASVWMVRRFPPGPEP